MSQHDFDIANAPGATVRSDMNAAVLALASQNAGASAPPTTTPFMMWPDTTNSVLRQRNAGDTDWIIVGSLDLDQIIDKTTAYTLLLRDYGKLVRVDTTAGAWTLGTFAAAADLEGWRCRLHMIGTGGNALTIDPDSSDQVNGATTIDVVDGDVVDLYCDGAGWRAVTTRPATELIPAGVISPFAGSAAPTGWLFARGQAVSRTTYAALFAVLGTTFGAGDGSTTFALPDMRGRVPAGWQQMDGTDSNLLNGLSGGVNGDSLGATGGAESHQLTTTEMPAHTHDYLDFVVYYILTGSYGEGGAANARFNESIQSSTRTSVAAGGNGSHNNVQPTIMVSYIIKA